MKAPLQEHLTHAVPEQTVSIDVQRTENDEGEIVRLNETGDALYEDYDTAEIDEQQDNGWQSNSATGSLSVFANEQCRSSTC